MSFGARQKYMVNDCQEIYGKWYGKYMVNDYTHGKWLSRLMGAGNWMARSQPSSWLQVAFFRRCPLLDKKLQAVLPSGNISPNHNWSSDYTGQFPWRTDCFCVLWHCLLLRSLLSPNPMFLMHDPQISRNPPTRSWHPGLSATHSKYFAVMAERVPSLDLIAQIPAVQLQHLMPANYFGLDQKCNSPCQRALSLWFSKATLSIHIHTSNDKIGRELKIKL